MQVSGAERRRFVRVPGHSYELTYQDTRALRVLDVSAGGALFEAPRPLLVGSRVPVKVWGRGHAEAALFEVKRCETAPYERPALIYKIGGQFHPPFNPKIINASHGWGFLVKPSDRDH